MDSDFVSEARDKDSSVRNKAMIVEEKNGKKWAESVVLNLIIDRLNQLRGLETHLPCWGPDH